MSRTYQTCTVQTADGFQLTLYRSPSPLGEGHGGRPVVLLPGLGSNRLTFGIARGQTLACALNAVGRDVWLVDFRGSASSRFVGASHNGSPTIDLLAKLDTDLPCALAEIHRVTGAERVDLVGHSVGGLFANLYSARNPTRVGRVVTVCSPLDFADVLGRMAPLARAPARTLARLSRRLGRVPVVNLAKVGGPVPHLVALRAHFGWSSSDRHLRRRYLNEAVEDLSGSEITQILSWVGGKSPPPVSPRATLATTTTPTLVVGAADDRVVPIAQVRAAFEALGSPEKRLLQIGRKHGALHDYGHAGILIAPDARHDVYPSIVGWLSVPTTASWPVPKAGQRTSALALLRTGTVID